MDRIFNFFPHRDISEKSRHREKNCLLHRSLIEWKRSNFPAFPTTAVLHGLRMEPCFCWSDRLKWNSELKLLTSHLDTWGPQIYSCRQALQTMVNEIHFWTKSINFHIITIAKRLHPNIVPSLESRLLFVYDVTWLVRDAFVFGQFGTRIFVILGWIDNLKR